MEQVLVEDITVSDADSIYGAERVAMKATMESVLEQIEIIRVRMRGEQGMDPVEHVLGRIKGEESMREKCRRKGLPETADSALTQIRDAIGIRVVCSFLDDIYDIRDALTVLPGYELVEEKDYIKHVKPNGYRSLHLILKVSAPEGTGRDAYFVEIQLRTISMDTWAALEHHLKYKQDIGARTGLIVGELKRCADELASTDASMQTIRDMMNGE